MPRNRPGFGRYPDNEREMTMRGWITVVCLAAALGWPAAGDAASLDFRGRLHLDYAFHDEDGRDLEDDGRVRTGRLGIEGELAPEWEYLVEYDFAGWDANPKDVYVRYTGLGPTLTLGHFKAPFSLDNLTSSNSIPFIERALPVTTFSFPERLGASVSGGDDRFRYTVSAIGRGFGSTARSSSGSGNISDDGRGLAARFTHTRGFGSDGLLHFGAAVTTEGPDHQDDRPVRFRTRPESRPSELRFADTGNLGEVDRINQAGIEFAGALGSGWWQAEYMISRVELAAGGRYDLNGGYISAGWILSGETRPYKAGVFKGIKPGGSAGAWELTARVSRVDLDDDGLSGGRQTNLTLGVNWYLRSNLRFMANLISVDSRRAGIDDDPAILLFRGQFHF